MSDFLGQVETCSSCEFSRSMRISMGAPDAETSLCTIHYIERLTAQLAESERKLAEADREIALMLEAEASANARIEVRERKLEESERKAAKLETERDAMAKVIEAADLMESTPDHSYRFGEAYANWKAAKAELEKLRGSQ